MAMSFLECYPDTDFLASIDNIELNISSVAVDTGSAAQELTTAAEYQRKAGKRAACLMLVVAVVAAIVLLAVSYTILSSKYPVPHLGLLFTPRPRSFDSFLLTCGHLLTKFSL